VSGLSRRQLSVRASYSEPPPNTLVVRSSSFFFFFFFSSNLVCYFIKRLWKRLSLKLQSQVLARLQPQGVRFVFFRKRTRSCLFQLRPFCKKAECSFCGRIPTAMGEKLSRCARCHKTRYCSRCVRTILCFLQNRLKKQNRTKGLSSKRLEEGTFQRVRENRCVIEEMNEKVLRFICRALLVYPSKGLVVLHSFWQHFFPSVL
jgi:hypothetical protein